MDNELLHSQTCETRSSSELRKESGTPKEYYCVLPLTPPTSEKHNHSLPTLSVVQQVVRSFRRSQHFSTQHSSLQPFDLPLGEFQELLETLKNEPSLKRCIQDKVRYDYNPGENRLTIRMPSPVHDFFATLLAQEITDFLRRVSARQDATGRFAASIFNGGSSRIIMQDDLSSSDELSSKGPKLQRQPDAQFQHRHAAYPGVVLEISYSQNGNELDKLAWDYIMSSNGDIKAVIGVDISYGGVHSSTVSLWRAITSSDADGASVLDVKREITNQPFRAADKSKINPHETLGLNLSDFATDELTDDYEPVECLMSYDKLAELLDQAERMQHVREAEDGGQGIKSAQKVKKRKRPPTSDDGIKSDDEKLFREQELASAERVMASDKEFNVPSRKRRI